MKIVFLKKSAVISLNKMLMIMNTRVFFLIIPILLFKVSLAYSIILDNAIPKYNTAYAKNLSLEDNERIDPNYISINTLLKTSYCTGESAFMYADAQGVYNSGNVFSVVLSDASGSFANAMVIGTLGGSASGVYTLNFRIPINMPVGNGYRVRIVASNPLTTSNDNNFDIQITTIPQPSTTPQSICAGQSTTLAATCTTGNPVWYKATTGDSTLTSTTVSPIVTTDYYVACESGTICYSIRKQHTLTVNQLTGVSLASAFSSCIDSDVNLSVVTSQTGLTYAWSGPNGFTSTSQIASITNLNNSKTGTYTVLVTSPSSCSITATTVVGISQSLPNLSISGDTAVCFNGTISLNANTSLSNGVTYSWTGPHSFTATGQSISRIAFTDNGQGLTTYHDGIYTLHATNSATGCSGNASVNIHVGNKPNIPVSAPSSSVCEGTTHNILFTFGGANFQNYAWTGPNGFTSTSLSNCNATFQCNDAQISIANFSNTKVGTYSVVANFLDNNNRMCAVSANAVLTFKTKPDITISSNLAICAGQSLNFTTTYTDATAGIASYAWTGPNNFTSSTQNPTLNAATANAAGVYTLVVVGMNQCVASATTSATVMEALPPIVSPTAQVVLSNLITLTASGCAGILSWYKTSDNQLVNMPVSPTVTTLYYAKCNLSGCVSAKSGDITVSIGAPIAISIKTGDWEDKSTWNINRVPLPIDSVIIDANHTVTIHGQYSAKWMSFRNNGTISFSTFSGNLNILGNPKTAAPTLLTVTANQITYSGFSSGCTIKIYKNGVYINQITADNNGTWTGLVLTTGLYTITASEAGKNESVPSNAIQYTVPPQQTSTPTLLTVTGSQISYSGYANGTTLKLYKNGVYTNLSVTANSSTWIGLNLATGLYTITSTETGKTESGQSNSIQYNTLPATATPTLLAVTGTLITYTNYTHGATFKLYKDGTFINETFLANGNEWTGLNLSTGSYTFTSTESGKAESAQSNAVQYSQPSGQTGTPTLVTVAGNRITYSGYTNGTTLKLFRNGTYINQSYTANSNEWTGLNLSTGLYTITATESGKYESGQSNSIQYTSISTQTGTPTLLTVATTRITYSGYSNGATLKLYKDAVFTNQTYVANGNEWAGLNLSNGLYTITATESGKTESAQSNSVQFTVPSANVIIIEPNKPQYYFSDGHPASYYDNQANLPAIFTNQPQYDPINDLVWLKNDKIKIGINLKRGGQIAWASLLDATTNLVYNGYDGGFQVTLDAYQKKDGYTQGGEVSGSGIPGQPSFSYNVTHGGDFLNHAVSLIDYHAIPNGYYVKLRPIHYPLTAKFSETYIESWYTIVRQSVKIVYRYTSFRTDGQWDGGGFDGAGAPACFIVNTLNKYKTYTGNAPWTFSPTEGNYLPITNLGQTPIGSQATEHWGMVYNQQNPNSGIGVYNNTEGGSSTYFTYKQQEVYPGNGPGTEFASGYTFFQPFIGFNIANRGSFVKDISAYLMLGNELEIRSEAYRISGHEGNIPNY
jgi:hypothetical protein